MSLTFLYCTPKQVKLGRELGKAVSEGGNFDLDPLISDLRDGLRKELNFSEINENIQWLRRKSSN